MLLRVLVRSFSLSLLELWRSLSLVWVYVTGYQMVKSGDRFCGSQKGLILVRRWAVTAFRVGVITSAKG
jgi:hypothetical protein